MSAVASICRAKLNSSSLRFGFDSFVQPDPNEVVVKSTQSVDFYAEKAFKLLNVCFLPFSWFFASRSLKLG